MSGSAPPLPTTRHRDVSVSEITGQLETSSLSTSVEHVFLDKIIYNHLIHDAIFLHLTPLEFLRVGRTCKLANSIVHTFIKRTFNINRFLARFFPDGTAFRSLQARTGTLVSGSFALQFFDRTSYPESDLDLYIPAKYDRQVVSWLVLHGYKFTPNAGQPADLEKAMEKAKEDGFVTGIVDDPHSEYTERSIEAVYNFSKPSQNDTPQLKIQCIIARLAPMHVVLSFHSSE